MPGYLCAIGVQVPECLQSVTVPKCVLSAQVPECLSRALRALKRTLPLNEKHYFKQFSYFNNSFSYFNNLFYFVFVQYLSG